MDIIMDSTCLIGLTKKDNEKQLIRGEKLIKIGKYEIEKTKIRKLARKICELAETEEFTYNKDYIIRLLTIIYNLNYSAITVSYVSGGGLIIYFGDYIGVVFPIFK